MQHDQDDRQAARRWERSRDLNAELREAVADAKHGRWARKTEFVPLADGRMRRRVTRSDGTVVRTMGRRCVAQGWMKAIKEVVAAADLPSQTTAYTLRHSVITDLVGGRP